MDVHLDAPLPTEIAVGAGTAVFVAGWCYAPQAPLQSLRLMVDGEPQPLVAYGMPRVDVYRALGDQRSYRSGFWGIARIPPTTCGQIDLRVRADVDGRNEAAELARIAVAPEPSPAAVAAPAPSDGPLVAICMATYEPERELLARQLRSIRAQTHRNWVCVISDDCSDPRRFAAIEAEVAGDARFFVSRSARRLGFYANFERALAMAPAGAGYVAMADQDDVWYPEKLATLLAAIGDARLVYSDACIVDRSGAVIADSYWGRRSNNHEDLLSLLVANAVTGAASLFRRDVLPYALPFPPAQFTHFHDHWVGLTALALGDIAYVDRPLYDYVQHGGASLGHAAATRVTALSDRLGRLRSDPRERVRMWRMHYFVDAARLMQFATVLLMRCGERMTPDKRRVLDRFLTTDRSLASLGRLWARGALEVAGRRSETLGAEWTLSHAFLWRRLVGATARTSPGARLRLEAMPPASLAPAPGRHLPQGRPRDIAEKIAPLVLSVRDDAPARVNLLIPTIDLEHFFGGYIAKLNLARRLAERGARVRVVTVDPVPPLPRSWQREVEAYEGLAGLFDRIEVAFGREAPLEVGRSDRFIATTWWSAHVAARASESLGGGRFLYLIQEYEPFTFPMGTYAALATGSYAFPHFALFSTELLRDYFRRHRTGVYAAGAAAGDGASAAFENAITAVSPPTIAEMAGRPGSRLLFYARPESHAERNMFDLGILALNQVVERGGLAGWDLHGIGTVQPGRRIDLGSGVALRLLSRADQRGYAALLREHDVGLALMYTPHPSLVPIEMAAAGMVTVTNSFENKTAEAMAKISSNLVVAEPTIEGIADTIAAAAAAAADYERRTRGGDVRWSRNWDQSFGEDLLGRVESFLGG